jgi:predicted flap endonuclease-1-like 5' DNA nuclease
MSEMHPHARDERLEWVYGIGETYAEDLRRAGIPTCYALATADSERIAAVLDVSKESAEEYITAARTTVGYYPERGENR